MKYPKKIIFFILFLFLILLSETLFCQNNDFPKRIISLGPTVTRQLSILGVEDRIVGITTYCNVPQLENREKIGTVTEVNLEKVLTLKPDLVIATALTNPKTIIRLKSFNIRVEIFEDAKNFNQLGEQFLSLAKLVNKEQVGREIILTAKRKLTKLEEEATGLSKQKAIVQIGADPLWVATKSSLINDFIVLAGGINIGPAGENGLVSREYIIKENPDVIIIIEMGILANNEKEIWSKFDTINAVANKRIYIIDSYDVCSPTPLSFVETLERIFQLLHPEVEYEHIKN